LDPNQLVEIRKLIKDISKNKTVIFSTHIMQEVSALCDKVVVINKGEIVANDSRKGSVNTTLVEFEGEINEDELKQIQGVISVFRMDATPIFKIVSRAEIDIRPEVFRFATDRRLLLVGLKQEEGSLENIFRQLTSTPEA
jgi:ABC-2 type transport system ATP-binding protein